MADLAIPGLQAPVPWDVGGAGGLGGGLGSGVRVPAGVVEPERVPRPVVAAPAPTGLSGIDLVTGGAGQGPAPAPFDPEARAEDRELAALAARAGAGPPGPGVPGSQQLVQGAQLGTLAGYASDEARLAALAPRAVTSANLAFPFVQRQAREQLAQEGQLPTMDFQPAPFDTPARASGESDADYMSRVQLAKMAHDTEQVDAAETAQAAFEEASGVPEARQVGKPGEVGFIEGERRTQEEMTEAQSQQVTQMAEAEIAGAQATQAAVADIQGAQAARQQDRQDQRDVLTQMQEVEAEARAKLEALPEFEAQRFSRQRSTGQKLLAVIGSIAGGFIGKPGLIAEQLERQNADDLREQKLNYDLGLQRYGAARGAVDQAMDLYSTIRDGLGDEEAADAMYLSLTEEDQVAMIREEAAKTSAPIAQSALNQEALVVEQQLRARRDANQLAAVSTPRTKTRIADSRMARQERERIIKRQEGREGFLQDLAEKGIDVSAAREKQEFERGTKREVAATAGRAKIEAEVVKAQVLAERDIKKATDEWGAVETLVDDFLKQHPDNIHGVGRPLSGSQEDRIKTRSFMSALELLMTTGFTGATATERQAEQVQGLIEGETFEVTDDAFRTRMGEILNIASSRRRYYQGQLGSPERRASTATELSSFQPM